MILYESDRVEVHHADARDLLPTIGTESVDLIVPDPPYGVEWQSNARALPFAPIANDTPDDRLEVRAILAECVRVVGQNRHLYVFGPNDVLDGLKVSSLVSLVWDKGAVGGGDLTAPWAPDHEPITFTTSKFRHAGESGRETVPARLRKGSIIRATRPTGRKVRHPSEKPVPLLMELIESSSRAGETVLDPFAGVGSTAVAAILRGRRAIIADVDAAYLAIAIERIRHAEALADQGANA